MLPHFWFTIDAPLFGGIRIIMATRIFLGNCKFEQGAMASTLAYSGGMCRLVFCQFQAFKHNFGPVYGQDIRNAFLCTVSSP